MRSSPRRVPVSASPTFASLFSGCGGLDLGFVDEGFQPTGAFDWDDDAVSHYKRNVHYEAVKADLATEHGFLSRLRPNVVVAGPPCQGFSTAGRRQLDDPRNHLLPLAGDLASRMKPRAIVIENVAAAQAGGHKLYWEQLEAQLRVGGYRTHTVKWNAADLGMAQSRRRLLLFAWRGSHDPDFTQVPEPTQRLDAVLAGVERLSSHRPVLLDPGSRLFKIAARIGPGQKLCNVRGGPRSVHTWHIPEVFGKTTARECQMLELIMRLRRQERRRDWGDADPVRMHRLKLEFGCDTRATVQSLLDKQFLCRKDDGVDLCRSFNGKCRRFRWEETACAVDTRFGDPHLFLHPNENRPFTVREAARIQGFPDTYIFEGAEKDMFRLIGNAVPPPMARRAAQILRPLFSL